MIKKAIFIFCIIGCISCTQLIFLHTSGVELSDNDKIIRDSCINILYNSSIVSDFNSSNNSTIQIGTIKYPLFIAKNETDSIYYLGVIGNRYVTPIYLSCLFKDFKIVNYSDENMGLGGIDSIIVCVDSNQTIRMITQGSTSTCYFDAKGHFVNCFSFGNEITINFFGKPKKMRIY